MDTDSKLLVIGGITLTLINVIFLSIDYIGYYFLAGDPGTLFLLLTLHPYLWTYLILSGAILIIGLVARNREGYVIGGIALAITLGTLIYHLWYIIGFAIPYFGAVPALMSTVIFLALTIITIMIVLANIGSLLKLVHGRRLGA